jgi:L-aminopeptidase/D-esterase-like protein
VNPNDAAIARAGFGIAVGHATDAAGGTGCTVVRGVDGPVVASAFVFGRATGTREVALLEPWASNERVDAILLTGGSAYGLDAAAGVMHWMEERGRGFPIAGGVVPIVPAAVVFDLAPFGRFDARPTAEMAYRACEAATPGAWEEGSVGVGTGCTVGKALGRDRAMKGGVGVGFAGTDGDEGILACAVSAVNALGHVRGYDDKIIAGPRKADQTIADAEVVTMLGNLFGGPEANTTISVVGLNHSFTKVELHQIARAASAAHARRIGPAGTTFDGDVIFAVCPLGARRGQLVLAEVAATKALEQAIVRGVTTAKGRDGIPGLAD